MFDNLKNDLKNMTIFNIDYLNDLANKYGVSLALVIFYYYANK